MKKNTSKTKGSTRSSNLKKAKLEDWKRRSTKAVSKKQDPNSEEKWSHIKAATALGPSTSSLLGLISYLRKLVLDVFIHQMFTEHLL